MAIGVTGRSQRAVTAAQTRAMKDFDKAVSDIQGATLKGLTQAVLLARKESRPMTPKLTGNLRGHTYVAWEGNDGTIKKIGSKDSVVGDDVGEFIKEGGKNRINVVLGNSAAYAIYVHEINKNYVVGGWKYLTKAILNVKDKMLQLIIKNAKDIKK